MDGVFDQFAKFERAKTAERTRRGKLRKVQEGKLLAGSVPNFGFKFKATRDGYQVDEEAIQIVRRIFYMVGVEGRTLYGVGKVLRGGRRADTKRQETLVSDDCPQDYQ